MGTITKFGRGKLSALWAMQKRIGGNLVFYASVIEILTRPQHFKKDDFLASGRSIVNSVCSSPTNDSVCLGTMESPSKTSKMLMQS